MPSGIEAVCTAALIADVVPLSIITKHIISLHLEKIYEIACMAILEPVSRASKQWASCVRRLFPVQFDQLRTRVSAKEHAVCVC